MIIKTVVPKIGDDMPALLSIQMHYLGKPVYDENGKRIGSISDVIDDGDHLILIMAIEDN